MKDDLYREGRNHLQVKKAERGLGTRLVFEHFLSFETYNCVELTIITHQFRYQYGNALCLPIMIHDNGSRIQHKVECTCTVSLIL